MEDMTKGKLHELQRQRLLCILQSVYALYSYSAVVKNVISTIVARFHCFCELALYYVVVNIFAYLRLMFVG